MQGADALQAAVQHTAGQRLDEIVADVHLRFGLRRDVAGQKRQAENQRGGRLHADVARHQFKGKIRKLHSVEREEVGGFLFVEKIGKLDS